MLHTLVAHMHIIFCKFDLTPETLKFLKAIFNLYTVY